MLRRQSYVGLPPRKPNKAFAVFPIGLVGFVTVLAVTLIYVVIVRGPDTHASLQNGVPDGYERTQPQFVVSLPEPTLAPTPTPSPTPRPTPTAQPGQTQGPATQTPAATPSPVPTATPRQISFAQDVLPVFRNACAMCHGQAISLKGVSLASYQALMDSQNKLSLFVPGNPDESLLIKVLEGKATQMPPSGPLSKEQIELIRSWIKQGAQNN